MSRDLTKLSPFMQEKSKEFLAKCHEQGLSDVVIICTDRSDAEQQACFDAGNSHAKPGQSAHNAVDANCNPASEAFDIGIIANGKYFGDHPDYAKAGLIGESIGLVWAGRWVSMKEEAHLQNPNWVKPK